MGGGGANSLDSPKIGESSDFESDKLDSNLTDIDDNQDDAISEYTYKSYDDYFIDYNITADTITEQDLTGIGSAVDPYIVRSTKGFLWLTNNALSGISLNSKYVELACDIVLNEEIFDENGTPSGGDGIIYEWSPIPTGNKLYFDGKEKSIKGLYYNDETKNYVGLFGKVETSLISNIIFCNVNLLGCRYVALFPWANETISNCELKSGRIVGNCYVAGFSSIVEKIINCTNYANITAERRNNSVSEDGYYVGGIVSSVLVETNIVNCVNLGNVLGYQRVGGIIGNCGTNSTLIIENCSNFGDVCGISINTGGICGLTNRGKIAKLKKCANYGKVTATGNVSAMFGFISGDASLVDCSNYGKITSTGSNKRYWGELIGRIDNDAKNNTEVYIENGNSYLQDSDNAIFGSSFIESGEVFDNKIKITIENCDIITSRSSKEVLFFLLGETELFIKNCSFEMKTETISSPLLHRMEKNTRVCISNTKIIQNNTTLNPIYRERYSMSELYMSSCIYLGVGRKYYYGSDFSGFYLNWKTGEIGLKALSGKGFYQNSLAEEILIAKGYEKKTI